MSRRFTAEALKEIAALLSTIAADSPRTALRFEAALFETLDRIEFFPESGRLVRPEEGVRMAVLPRWSCVVLYVRETEGILIRNVRAAGRLKPWES